MTTINLMPVTVFMSNKDGERLSFTFVVEGINPQEALGKVVLHIRTDDQFADMQYIASSVGTMKQLTDDGFALIDINEVK